MKTKFTFIFILAMTLAFSRVNAQTVILEENFDTEFPEGLPQGWQSLDADGDDHEWYQIINTAITGHSGTGLMTSQSYVGGGGTGFAVTPDNYLITPEVPNAGHVTYWVSAQDASWAGEHYGIMASTTGTAEGDFTLVFEETMTAKGPQYVGQRGANAQGTWYERSVELPAGTRYVAFRHFNCTDMFRLNLDDVKITASDNSINTLQGQGINVLSGNGMLVINASTEVLRATPVQIYNVSGQLVNSFALTQSETTVQLPAGAYIVRVGKAAQKAMVK